jgi:hypothetical protein
MVTSTIDKLGEAAASVAGRVAESARVAETLAKDARMLKDRAADAIEDGVYTAKRTVTRTLRELEDLKRDAETRVRKAPLSAVGVTPPACSPVSPSAGSGTTVPHARASRADARRRLTRIRRPTPSARRDCLTLRGQVDTIRSLTAALS